MTYYQWSSRKCLFCKNKTQVDYKDFELLSHYLSPTGRILPRRRTGLCAKHQRKIARAIKQARHLALLPFLD